MSLLREDSALKEDVTTSSQPSSQTSSPSPSKRASLWLRGSLEQLSEELPETSATENSNPTTTPSKLRRSSSRSRRHTTVVPALNTSPLTSTSMTTATTTASSSSSSSSGSSTGTSSSKDANTVTTPGGNAGWLKGGRSPGSAFSDDTAAIELPSSSPGALLNMKALVIHHPHGVKTIEYEATKHVRPVITKLCAIIHVDIQDCVLSDENGKEINLDGQFSQIPEGSCVVLAKKVRTRFTLPTRESTAKINIPSTVESPSKRLLAQEFDPEKIIFVSFDEIIAELTHIDTPLQMMFEFLLTYRSFAPPKQVFGAFLDRFKAVEGTEDAHVVRFRIVSILRMWMKDFMFDFVKEKDTFLVEWEQFCNNWVQYQDASVQKICEGIIDRIKQAKYVDRLQKPPHYLANAPPVIPLNISDTAHLTFFDLDNTELSRQITLIEETMWRSIQPWELLDKAWTSNASSNAPNVCKITDWFNEMSLWAQFEILTEVKLKKRTRILAKFVDLLDKLIALNNFNGAMEIFAGLNASAVARLKRTWSGLPTKVSQAYERVSVMMQGESNYRALREAFRTRAPPLIPYVGMYLTDLVFIEDGNSDKSSTGNYVNFTKRKLVAKTIREIQLLQGGIYQLRPVPEIQEWITKRKRISEDELFSISQYLEPRDSQPHMEIPPILAEIIASQDKDDLASSTGSASGNSGRNIKSGRVKSAKANSKKKLERSITQGDSSSESQPSPHQLQQQQQLKISTSGKEANHIIAQLKNNSMSTDDMLVIVEEQTEKIKKTINYLNQLKKEHEDSLMIMELIKSKLEDVKSQESTISSLSSSSTALTSNTMAIPTMTATTTTTTILSSSPHSLSSSPTTSQSSLPISSSNSVITPRTTRSSTGNSILISKPSRPSLPTPLSPKEGQIPNS